MDKEFNLILYLSDLFYQVASAFDQLFKWCSQYTLNELINKYQDTGNTSWIADVIIDLIQGSGGVPFGDYTLFEIFFVSGLLYFVLFNLLKWVKK